MNIICEKLPGTLPTLIIQMYVASHSSIGVLALWWI